LRHVRALTVSDEIGRLAYVVLRTVNRMQAKGSTVRIVAPRDPDVAHELGMDTDEDVILTAVEYLLEQGYVVPAGLDLQGGLHHRARGAGVARGGCVGAATSPSWGGHRALGGHRAAAGAYPPPVSARVDRGAQAAGSGAHRKTVVAPLVWRLVNPADWALPPRPIVQRRITIAHA
jgi:hypothetical protein